MGYLINVDLDHPENTNHLQTRGVSLDPHSWLGGISCLYLLPCLPLFDMLTCCTLFLSPQWEDRVGRSVRQDLILVAKYRCASHKQNLREVCVCCLETILPQRQKCSVRVFAQIKRLCRHVWACEHRYMSAYLPCAY